MTDVTVDMIREAKRKLNHPDEISLVELLLLGLGTNPATSKVFGGQEHGKEWLEAWRNNCTRRINNASKTDLVELLVDPSLSDFKIHKSWRDFIEKRLIYKLEILQEKFSDLRQQSQYDYERLMDQIETIRDLKIRLASLGRSETKFKKLRANARKLIRQALKDKNMEALEAAKKYIITIFGAEDGQEIIKNAEAAYAKTLGKDDSRIIRYRDGRTQSPPK